MTRPFSESAVTRATWNEHGSADVRDCNLRKTRSDVPLIDMAGMA